MSNQRFSDAEMAQYHEDGYVVVPDLLDAAEIEILRRVAKNDQSIEQQALSRNDGEGGITKLRLWNEAGDDLYGVIARSQRIVDRLEQMLGGEVYYYHSKMNFKEPFTGGAWAWHQDYGYWYNNGCLFPSMASVFIALDPATRENGCLQVLRGSHQMGRVEHGKFGQQTGADPERVAAAMERLELVYCEMGAGDALFFHGNTLHASDANLSDKPRWGLLCCYNTKMNDPYKDSHHPRYTPLKKVGDAAIIEIGAKGSDAGKKFLDPARDRTQHAKA